MHAHNMHEGILSPKYCKEPVQDKLFWDSMKFKSEIVLF